MSRALTGLLAAMLALATAWPAGATGGLDQRFAALEKGVRPGAVVALVRGGKVVQVGAYGYARLTPRQRMARGTLFDLASVSKQMTAMAIAWLAERGRLDLDAPITTYLDGWPKWAKKVTVRHLLHHTSGLPDYLGLMDGAFDAGHEPSSDEVAALVARQKRPDAPPGRAFDYSNSGYMVLGRIVAAASGRAFPAFMRAELFGPLGMKTAYVAEGPARANAAHAHGHAKAKRGWRAWPREAGDRISGDGGVHATIDDMIAWTRAYQPGVLVSAKTLKAVATPGRAKGGATGYGFGVWSADGVLSHDGSWGGFATAIAMRPADRDAAIVLANLDGYESMWSAEALLGLD